MRVIAATHKPLEQAVAAREFREDLFYRLNVVRVHIPPLRERRGDIPLLVNYFLKKFAQARGRAPKSILPAAAELLERFHWPGLGTKRLVIPPLNGGQPEHHPFPGNGVAPLFGGQFLELPLQFAGAGRRRQKRSDDAEAKMRPALVGPAVLRFIFHTVSFLRFFRRFHWRRFASTTRADGRHLASCAGNPISLIQLAALLPREQ